MRFITDRDFQKMDAITLVAMVEAGLIGIEEISKFADFEKANQVADLFMEKLENRWKKLKIENMGELNENSYSTKTQGKASR